MNHAAIQKGLKIATGVAFGAVICYQLYRIMTDGGFKEDGSEESEKPTSELAHAHPEGMYNGEEPEADENDYDDEDDQ